MAQKKLSTRKKVRFAGGCLGLLLLAVLATEGALRVAGYPSGLVRTFGKLWNRDPESLAKLPGLFAPSAEREVAYPPELAYRVRFNASGLRGPELRVPKPRVRILALGDSVTFGYHVQDAETYPAQLRKLVPDDVEVINGGCGSFTITDERRYLEQRLLALEPDVVVLQFCANDVVSAELDRDPLRYDEILMDPGGSSWFRETALGEVQLRLAISLKSWRRGPPQNLGDPAQPIEPRHWARYAEELAALKQLLDARQVPLLLVAFTDLDVTRNGAPSPYDVELQRIADELGIPFASTLPAYRAQPEATALYLYPLDGHPSALGNRVLAEVVRALLRSSGALP
ncbi:MAG: SGNH/GDSL hydrolase family protein [Planctomycetes bacterium]|nr:SGNH/GDSL hydrolase family protein [Planctomycetota bacterium]